MDITDLSNEASAILYHWRRSRKAHPEGTFDGKSRWYPSEREDANGDGSCVRCPSASWPYSYMLRCRTREHCIVLVRRGFVGHDVPVDVWKAVASALEWDKDTPFGIIRDYVVEGCPATA